MPGMMIPGKVRLGEKDGSLANRGSGCRAERFAWGLPLSHGPALRLLPRGGRHAVFIMSSLEHLFEANRQWASEMRDLDAAFFDRLCEVQEPLHMWIGCADSRVSADQIVGLMPGELFVHRNVANLAVHTDMNFLSVLQYAVEVLKVQHIIVCGHYGCGGIRAVVDHSKLGLIDNWLRHVKDIYNMHKPVLEAETDPDRRTDLLCEFNVTEQVKNVARTTILQDAWRTGQEISVHGWVYSLKDGLLKDLDITITSREMVEDEYQV